MAVSASDSIGDAEKVFDHHNQSKKSDVMKEILQLNTRARNLEKEKTSQLYNRRSKYRDVFLTLEESDQKMAEFRRIELIKLQQQIDKVKNSVFKFRRELDDMKPTPDFVERLKIIMEDIEQNISCFKEQQKLKFDELLQEERILIQEVCALEKRFDTWSHAAAHDTPSARGPQGPLKSARDVNKCLPPEVAAFDKFVQQTGGMRGGWDEYDHGTFLKLRSRHKGKATFLSEAGLVLPTRTSDHIQEHEQWYQDYLNMVHLKKEAIKKWKDEKEVEKDEKLTQLDREQMEAEKLSKQMEEERLRQTEEQKLQQYSRLKSWKTDRQKQKEFENAKRRREEKKKAAEEEAWKLKQMELREQVSDYRKRRADDRDARIARDEALRAAEEEQRKRELAEKSLQIKERSQQLIDGRKAKAEARLRAEADKQARLERFKEQVRVEVISDPQRLLQPTEGWKERQRQTDDSTHGRVYQMPHRAVPTWRQNMN